MAYVTGNMFDDLLSGFGVRPATGHRPSAADVSNASRPVSTTVHRQAASQSDRASGDLPRTLPSNFMLPLTIAQLGRDPPATAPIPNTMDGQVESPAQQEPKPPPPRACTICTEVEAEDDLPLIKACRSCPADYCAACLYDMFETSLEKNTRFPPRCCSLIQLFTVLDDLPKEAADKYRSKLEEWMTADKTYCPSPSCSAFIPSRLVPAPAPPKVPEKTHLQQVEDTISELLEKFHAREDSRFFTGDVDMRLLPEYSIIVPNHVDLKVMRQKLEDHKYTSTAQLTDDMSLLVTNIKIYNGVPHPVVKAADRLYKDYLDNLSRYADRPAEKSSPLRNEGNIFACPSCHIAVCIACKQVEHQEKPCDLSKGDDELAMLATFGYKRCPRCKHGVKRMFGCSHMECNCGAHWCWWCARSIDDCMGDCGGPDTDEEDFDEEGDEERDSDDEDSEMADAPMQRPGPPTTTTTGPQNTNTSGPASTGAPPTQSDRIQNPVNLDAGGGRRWAASGLDFGDEPDDSGSVQVWSCHHHWKPFKVPEDGFNHGNLDLMECNRCFKDVKPPRRGRKKLDVQQQAWECLACRLIVCVDCRDSYKETRVVESQ